jgi:hypothetical protein
MCQFLNLIDGSIDKINRLVIVKLEDFMKKIIFIFFISLLFCTCISVKNITYTDYEHSIDLNYLQIENFYIPTFDISINDNYYHAIYHTGYNKNIIGRDILVEFGIEDIDGKTEITIPEIVLTNGVILHNIIFHIVEPNDDIVKVYFGLSAFNEYNVLVSYKQKKIFLYNNTIKPDFLASWVSTTVVYPEEGLYIYSVVEGSEKSCLTWLSTGTTLFIGGFFNRHYNIGLNTNIPVASFFKNSIYIDGKKYRNLYFFNSLSNETKEDNNLEGTMTELILGYAFFVKYDIFIESNNKRIYLENQK